MVNVNEGFAVIVNALAPVLNTMLLTSVLAERKMPVVLDEVNVAVSDGPLGMVDGTQFAAWFQLPVAGLIFHVALLAKPLLAIENRSGNIATLRNHSGGRTFGRREGTASDIDEERSMALFIILLSGLHRHSGASPPCFPLCASKSPTPNSVRLWSRGQRQNLLKA
jgi:hypothetical protein